MARALPEATFDRDGLRVAVIGLGYVGIPLALAFVDAGSDVVGVDVDASRLAYLASGRSPVDTASDRALAKALAAGRLQLEDAATDLRCVDAILICVPTPLRTGDRPDTRHIETVCGRLAATLRRGQLVVLCSTTYPGTTRDLCRPALETSGLRAGCDFFLAHAPERLDPGGSPGAAPAPRVVGGETEACARHAAALLRRAGYAVVRVSDTQTAELTKLLENTFRLVNVALIHEIARMCHAIGGLDVWEVIDAAATKPYGFMPFLPGPGVGGHCVPVDPHYLAWRGAACGVASRLIAAAAEVTREMPSWVVERTTQWLARDGITVRGARVLALGAAYKADVGDVRESPAVEVMAQLDVLGAEVSYHDPHVREVQIRDRTLRSVPLDADQLVAADLAVILTDHARVDYAHVCRHARRVFDARNATRALGAPANVERL